MPRLRSVRANKNERMIEIRLRLWTDSIAGRKGYVVPKLAWSSGTIRMERNETHGIKPNKARPFNSLLDLGVVIEKLLIAQGITLRPSKRMKRYIEGGRN